MTNTQIINELSLPLFFFSLIYASISKREIDGIPINRSFVRIGGVTVFIYKDKKNQKPIPNIHQKPCPSLLLPLSLSLFLSFSFPSFLSTSLTDCPFFPSLYLPIYLPPSIGMYLAAYILQVFIGLGWDGWDEMGWLSRV